MRLLLLLALVLAPARAQDPLDGAGLDAMGQSLLTVARKHEAAGAWSQAAAAYELVLQRDPSYRKASLALARVLVADGRRREAERVYRGMPMDDAAVEALAALIMAERPAEAAELYRRLQTLRLGDIDPLRQESEAALAAGDLARATSVYERYLELGGASEDPVLAGAQMVALADACLAVDTPERRADAQAGYERYLRLWPEGEHSQHVQGRLDRLAVEAAAESLAIGGAESLSTTQRTRLEEARRLLGARRPGASGVPIAGLEALYR